MENRYTNFHNIYFKILNEINDLNIDNEINDNLIEIVKKSINDDIEWLNKNHQQDEKYDELFLEVYKSNFNDYLTIHITIFKNGFKMFKDKYPLELKEKTERDLQRVDGLIKNLNEEMDKIKNVRKNYRFGKVLPVV